MSIKRRVIQDEYSENHERWLVSYADFITLLFAFFVVMYAVSSVSENKYQVLSDSLVNAFNNESSEPVVSSSPILSPIAMQQPIPVDSKIITDEKKVLRVERKEKMKHMAKDILQALAPLIQNGKVRVTQSIQGITVEINASVLFSPGQAKLEESSLLALRAVAHVVKDHEHEIHVEGHTDNMPISTANFPSNWELSTARSSSVIRLFVENGVAPHRLTALGYGENRSVESNDTSEGRKRNRRVAVMILSAEPDKITEIPVSFASETEITE